MENNIFKYAPNELVQDAFICWLLNWINSKNDEENIKEVAKSILEKIIEDYKGKKQTINYSNFKIIPQYPIKLDNYKIYDENSKQVFKKKKAVAESQTGTGETVPFEEESEADAIINETVENEEDKR